jgi:hypothetical protein
MKKHLLSFLLGAAVLSAAGSASAEDYFTYWTELQLANLTGFDMKITKTDWKGLDDDSPHVKAGDVIPAETDPNNPTDPTYIGRVSKWSAGVKIKIWFRLVGHEGSEDCYLYIDNPYTGHNSVTPSKTFPLSQCPSLAVQTASGETQDTPLYHNIQLPSSGHKLSLVSILAFQDLYNEGDFDDLDEDEVNRQIGQQLNSATSDRSKFQQEFGIPLP